MGSTDNGEHVFVVGSSRSGTTLVNTILLSSPLYARYRAETQLLNGCEIKYGDLAKQTSKKRFLTDWLRSRQFKRSGLTQKEFETLLFNKNTTSYIHLLSGFMNMVSAKQDCQRWVDSTPGNAFCLAQISIHFPNAKVIHVIRDGRAVALSLAKLGWSGVRTKNHDKALCYSAIKWEHSVLAAQSAKDCLGSRYHEIQYEKLVADPKQEIEKLSSFLQVPGLSYKENQSSAESKKQDSSELKRTNSAFGDMPKGISTHAANRWKKSLSKRQICKIEAIVDNTLKQLGYTSITKSTPPIRYLVNGYIYRITIGLKRYLKYNFRLGKLTISPLELDQD